MAEHDHLLSGHDIIASIRSNDPRIDIVVEAFVAQRLGWTLDDPVDQVTELVLETPASRGGYVIGAKRLLEHLDSLVAREWIAENGEDAHHAVMARLDERVRKLTYQRDQARAALNARNADGTGEQGSELSAATDARGLPGD